MYSLFSVPHDRFKLGEEITIFINQDDGEIFFVILIQSMVRVINMNIKLKNYLKINKEMLTFSKKNTRITNQ